MKATIITPPVSGRDAIGREGRCSAKQPAEILTLPPMALVYPATVLGAEGVETEVFDGVCEKERAIEGAVRGKDLVCINIATPEDIKHVEKLREMTDAHISCFGLMPTIRPEEMLRSGCDSAVTGESEWTVRELAQALKTGKLEKVKGLAYKKNGRMIRNGPREMQDLDKLPMPDRSLIDQKRYRFRFNNEIFTTILAGRGCPHGCRFCHAHLLAGRERRIRAPGAIVQELKKIIEDHGRTTTLLQADDFTGEPRYVDELCKRITEEGIETKWMCNSRVDAPGWIYGKMAKAGCRYAGFGIETGSEGVLARTKKGTTKEQAKKALKAAREAGIETIGYFIIGLPGETTKTAEETIEFAKELDLDYIVICGLRAWAGEEKAGLAEEEIEGIIKETYKKFYFRPKVIGREAWKMLAKGNHGSAGIAKEFIHKLASGKSI